MMIPFCLIVLTVFVALIKAGTSFWIIFPVVIVILAAWSLLTNYLAWRFIGWAAVEEEKQP
jgi:hypothetical protein